MDKLNALKKIAVATPLSDALGGILWAPLTPATTIGSYAGLLTDDERKHDKSKLKAFLPGVGAYRMSKRLSSQVHHEQEDARKAKDEKVRPVAHAMAELAGPATSIALPTLAGAILGNAFGHSFRGNNDAIGGGAAWGASLAGLSTILGAIGAAISRRRTKKEQMESDKKSVLLKYLVPGVASYNAFKRIGRSQGDRDEAEQEKKNKEKK